MGVDPTAVVLTGYPIDPLFVHGGAQRVAGDLCDRLIESGWIVDVIECAAWRESIGPEHSFVAGMAGHSAIARRWRGAGLATVMPAEQVDRVVGRARLVLAVDRAVGRLGTTAHRVLLLSNLVYENERQAAGHGDHDAVWVASPYLARQFAAGPDPAPAGVHIVPPALAASRCDAVAHVPLRALERQLTAAAVSRNRRLLFPHRADPGKGLTTALAVLRHLLQEDRWALVVIGPGVYDGATGVAFVDNARQVATAAGLAEHVFWVPWLPQSEVLCLYPLAGVTLMPSTLDEGFGLVAVESVMQGVPVVARPVGNLCLLANRFPSVHLAGEVTEMARTITAVSSRVVTIAERRAVCQVFSVAAQRAAVRAALHAGTARA